MCGRLKDDALPAAKSRGAGSPGRRINMDQNGSTFPSFELRFVFVTKAKPGEVHHPWSHWPKKPRQAHEPEPSAPDTPTNL